MNPRIISLLFLVCAINVPEVSAQQQTPEQVAVEMMAAARATDWGRMAGLMDRGALRQLREVVAPVLEFEGPDGPALRETLLGFSSLEKARLASDSAIFVSLLRFMMTQQEGVGDAMQSAEFTVVGTVPEGQDTVHVVVRMHMCFEGVDISTMEVVSLRRSGDQWRGLLKGDLTALAQALRDAFEGR